MKNYRKDLTKMTIEELKADLKTLYTKWAAKINKRGEISARRNAVRQELSTR